MLNNKAKNLLITTLLIMFLSLRLVGANPLPLKNKIITIDAGHGGRDPGTSYQDILEKDLNLQIALALEKELSSQGATVYMIRRSDIDLSSIYDAKKKRGDLYRRLLKIKENKSDLYISLHINWYQNSSYKGAEVLYNSINKENKYLAESIMTEFSKSLNSNRQIHTTDLYMYKNTTTPGVLVECGYLSNSQERKLLTTPAYQEKLAKSITDGIINYYNSKTNIL